MHDPDMDYDKFQANLQRIKELDEREAAVAKREEEISYYESLQDKEKKLKMWFDDKQYAYQRRTHLIVVLLVIIAVIVSGFEARRVHTARIFHQKEFDRVVRKQYLADLRSCLNGININENDVALIACVNLPYKAKEFE